MKGRITRLWAYVSILLVFGVILFLFVYIYAQGHETVTLEFLTQPPRGAILGLEGGIWPAIAGSLCFTGVAVLIGGLPAIATALYLVFYCENARLEKLLHLIIHCISGVPSIVLGLFSYSLLVRDLQWGRCILSAGVALGIMILPFIEVRAEKTFREVPDAVVLSSAALGCSKRYTITRIVLPTCLGELISGLLLGGCYAMGATAPLIFTGGVAYAAAPTGLMQPAMALPLHLYLLLAQGAPSFPMAYGTALVMMGLLLLCNLPAAVYAARRHAKARK